MLGTTGGEVIGLYAIIVPSLVLIMGGLIHLSIRFGRVEGWCDAHEQAHNDRPREIVWTKARRRSETGHD